MSKIQYTVRNVPPQLDKVLKKRAKLSGKSFNQTVVETLNVQAFGKPQAPETDAFSQLFGAGTLDKNFDQAVAELSQPDETLWK